MSSKLQLNKMAAEPVKTALRKNDMVKVITGRDKGKTGRIIDIDRMKGRVVVEGVMLMKKHVRPNPQRGIKGGIAEQEPSIHISNVMLVTADGTATRVGKKVETVGGKTRRTRIARKTGEVIEAKSK
jgi:large subunit ribosomal protein L24